MGLGPLILSWLAAVPGSVASGTLLGAPLSKGSKAGAFIFMFLTSIFIAGDICGRAGKDWKWMAPLAIALTLVAYVPWAASINKDPKNKSRAAALPLSGLLYAVVLMGASLAMYGGEVSKMAGLQGAGITLRYVFISASLGYQAVRAKKDPVARGQSIYMAGLLLLITMFDVLGASEVARKERANETARTSPTTIVNYETGETRAGPTPAAIAANFSKAGNKGKFPALVEGRPNPNESVNPLSKMSKAEIAALNATAAAEAASRAAA